MAMLVMELHFDGLISHDGDEHKIQKNVG